MEKVENKKSITLTYKSIEFYCDGVRICAIVEDSNLGTLIPALITAIKDGSVEWFDRIEGNIKVFGQARHVSSVTPKMITFSI